MTQQTKRKAGSGRQPQSGGTERRGKRLERPQYTTGDLPCQAIDQATARVRAAAQAAHGDFWAAWDAGDFAGAEDRAAQIALLVGPRDKYRMEARHEN